MKNDRLVKIVLECACTVPDAKVPKNHNCINNEPLHSHTAFFDTNTNDLFIPAFLTSIKAENLEAKGIAYLKVHGKLYISVQSLSEFMAPMQIQTIKEVFVAPTDPAFQKTAHKIVEAEDAADGIKTIRSFLEPSSTYRNNLVKCAIAAVEMMTDRDRILLLKRILTCMPDELIKDYFQDYIIEMVANNATAGRPESAAPNESRQLN